MYIMGALLKLIVMYQWQSPTNENAAIDKMELDDVPMYVTSQSLFCPTADCSTTVLRQLAVVPSLQLI